MGNKNAPMPEVKMDKVTSIRNEITRQIGDLLDVHLQNICSGAAKASMGLSVKINSGAEVADITTSISFVQGKTTDSVDGMVSYAQTEMFDA